MFVFDVVFEKDDSYKENLEILFFSIVARLTKQYIAYNFAEYDKKTDESESDDKCVKQIQKMYS